MSGGRGVEREATILIVDDEAEPPSGSRTLSGSQAAA
jgi:hypothetical protein